MLPSKPELTAEERHTIKSLFAENSHYSDTTKEIINGLVFGSDELFNVLTPFKIITKNGDRDYLRSAFDIQVGMELERDGKTWYSLFNREYFRDDRGGESLCSYCGCCA